MKIMFVTFNLHHPPGSGPFLRTESIIKALSKFADIYIYSLNNKSGIGGEESLKFYNRYCRKIIFAPSLKKKYKVLFKRIINKICKILFKKRIYHIDLREDDINYLIKISSKLNIDVIWLGFCGTLYDYLKLIKEKSNLKVVMDTDSVWSRFVLRGLPYIKDENERAEVEKAGRLKEEEEKWGTELADITTAVSKVDEAYFKDLVKNKDKVQMLSNVLDLEDYKNYMPAPPLFKKPCIYLAGSFGPGSPMDDAARWFINDIFPIVKKDIPDIHFYIIGNGSKTTLSDIDDPDISILGRVESVLPYLFNVDVAIVPLRFESGTRFKILEAGACRIPVVSTILGAEGIPVTDNFDISITDNEEKFANEIIRIIKDRQYGEMIASNLYKLIKEKFDIKILENETKIVVDELKNLISSSKSNQSE
jgi:polysaccharide biosynthesis protein PslH